VKLQEANKVGEAQLQKEKEHFLTEKVVVEEAVRKACRSVLGLIQEE
jgi:hypothetical protein